MAKGHKKRGRGGSRHSLYNDSSRGRGGGGSRGGRGQRSGRGRGRGKPIYMDEFDLPIQQWPSNNPPVTPVRDSATPQGRGRGSYSIPPNGHNNSRGGIGSPPGRGRGYVVDRDSLPYGRGRNLASKLKAGVPLSQLLSEDRPFLKPVKFVRSVYTATLFEKEEDIFQPVVEAAVDGDEQSQVPTADAVLCVFHRPDPDLDKAQSFGEEGEHLEEIDFADIGRFQAKVDAAVAKAKPVVAEVTAVEESTTFYVDTTPAPVITNQAEQIAVDRLSGALGEAAIDDDDDEEIIVYVAPHPRNGRSPQKDSSQRTEFVPSTSILTGVGVTTSTLISPERTKPVAPAHEASPTSAHAIFPSHPSPPQEELSKPAFTLKMGTLYPEGPPPGTQPFESPPEAEQLPPPPSFDSVSFSFSRMSVKKQARARSLHPVHTPRALLQPSRKARRKSLRGGFGAFGPMHEEAMLHEKDPRRAERRHGSDIDWGTSDEDEERDEGVDALSVDMDGMELDEGISLDAMKSFVHSMSAEGSKYVTMDDVEDIERMKKEDEQEDLRGPDSASEGESVEEEDDAHIVGGEREDSRGGGEMNASEDDDEDDDDDEVEAVMRVEENMLLAEADGSEEGELEDDDQADEDEDESEEEDETPKRGFQARLERLRAISNRGKGKGKARADEDSSDEAMSVQMAWADEDDYIESIEDIPAANQHLLSGNRKARRYMFKAVQNGDFDEEDMSMLQPAKRGKDKDVPPELQEQWEKDRQKKAENKRKRALARSEIAADPLAKHKGGKKGCKAMLAAARAPEDLPNRVVDLVSLEQQIRRFVDDIGGKQTMALPPADNGTRKHIHELAHAFNLKSRSKGKGDSRYTTLIKTSLSGIGINHDKIQRIMKRATNGSWGGPRGSNGGWQGKANLARHREGEEVGKDAAKIDSTNVGFKLLASMGWSDGDRIGLSGGLEAPLIAIMKKSKLGLGATASSTVWSLD